MYPTCRWGSPSQIVKPTNFHMFFLKFSRSPSGSRLHFPYSCECADDCLAEKSWLSIWQTSIVEYLPAIWVYSLSWHIFKKCHHEDLTMALYNFAMRCFCFRNHETQKFPLWNLCELPIPNKKRTNFALYMLFVPPNPNKNAPKKTQVRQVPGYFRGD